MCSPTCWRRATDRCRALAARGRRCHAAICPRLHVYKGEFHASFAGVRQSQVCRRNGETFANFERCCPDTDQSDHRYTLCGDHRSDRRTVPCRQGLGICAEPYIRRCGWRKPICSRSQRAKDQQRWCRRQSTSVLPRHSGFPNDTYRAVRPSRQPDRGHGQSCSVARGLEDRAAAQPCRCRTGLRQVPRQRRSGSDPSQPIRRCLCGAHAGCQRLPAGGRHALPGSARLSHCCQQGSPGERRPNLPRRVRATRCGAACLVHDTDIPGYADQYTVIVAADGPEGEILYSRSAMHHAKARAHVFEFSPGIAPRREIPFPRPISDFPVTSSTPLVRFPADWIDDTGKSVGNTTIATLGASSTTLPGVPQGDGSFLFRPANDGGDEQKMLNIFYFCNYMHDFLFILGFDEAAGNFQKINFSNVGLGNDPVRARAHSGAVNGTANMSTGPDGQPPLMNMGLVVGSGRHTAFDFDVVAHEYTHGLTNRLVGGRINAHALEEPQSGGMGEGWSDFFALTIQSFLHGREKVVVGDWVVNGAGGIRRAPYDDQYPFHYGQLVDFPEVHDIGEVWCEALMKMTRLIR